VNTFKLDYRYKTSLCFFPKHVDRVSVFTDLTEVMSVTPAAPARGPPKKTDEKSFFGVSKLNELDGVESFGN
jgi:hypothetical protein